MLDLISQLYALERACETNEPRAEVRSTRSRERLKNIQDWVLQQRALPQNPLGKAIAYMGDLWPGLVRFIDERRLALDNNACERALRGIVLGRKNHYGSRSERGTEVVVLFYSLIGEREARRHGVRCVFARCLTHRSARAAHSASA